MMTGTFNNDLLGVFRLELVPADGARQAADAILDTGFNDFLTLRQSIIKRHLVRQDLHAVVRFWPTAAKLYSTFMNRHYSPAHSGGHYELRVGLGKRWWCVEGGDRRAGPPYPHGWIAFLNAA